MINAWQKPILHVFSPLMLNLFKSHKTSHKTMPVSIKQRLADVHKILFIFPTGIPHARVARYTLAHLAAVPHPFGIFFAATTHILEQVKLPVEQFFPIELTRPSGEVNPNSHRNWAVQEFDALICLEPKPKPDLMDFIWQIPAPMSIGFSDGKGEHLFTVELVKRPTEFLENSYGSVLGLFGLNSGIK